MDDLAAVGCGVIIGKILWWGIILVPAILWLHPWILLIPLVVWFVIKRYGSETAAADVAATPAAPQGCSGPGRDHPMPPTESVDPMRSGGS
jgi:hypothetical protein